ncbi:MAG: diguanylate cyclase [Limnothrix sp.]
MSYQKASILIVDDVPDNFRLLSEMLREQNWQVRKAASGMMALQTIKERPPDLILLDTQMPDLDGYNVCRRLKSQEKTKAIPIIFLSTLNTPVDKVKAFSVGAADYISKPFDVEEVLARVNNQLQLHYLRRELEDKNEVLKKAMTEVELAWLESDKLKDDLAKSNHALLVANQKLALLAMVDGLTQVANRRRFDDYLEESWRHCRQEQQPLALIMGDIDCFKAYNDHYGHQMGDQCLQQIAQTIKASLLRPMDLVARYGGEEFMVILPNTNIEQAQAIAQRILEKIRNLGIAHATSTVSQTVSLSLGLQDVMPAQSSSPESLIKHCDQALYFAKKQGRDRLSLYTEIPTIQSNG